MELISIILDENKRIKKVFNEMSHEEINIYKVAYADAMEYSTKLEEYKRIQGQKFQMRVNRNDR